MYEPSDCMNNVIVAHARIDLYAPSTNFGGTLEFREKSMQSLCIRVKKVKFFFIGLQVKIILILGFYF